MLLTEKASEQINELISKGWEFMLNYGSNVGINLKQFGWEADFTRKLKNGGWDNHKPGYSKLNPSMAVYRAYDNIKKHRKYGVRG